MKILNINPFQETLYSGMCGPASLKIVLSYFGIDKSEEELSSLCNTDKELGITDLDIKRVSEKLGLKVQIQNNSTINDIENWLDKDIPVIVDWFTRGRSEYTDSEVADGHYSVVSGLDKKHIYLQDPEIGKIRKIKRDDFLSVWFDFKGKYISPNELIIRQLIAVYP